MTQNLIFSDHAKLRLKQRSIPKELVLETVEKPDKRKRSPRTRRLYQRKYGDKILEVVAVHENKQLVIITEYWIKI